MIKEIIKTAFILAGLGLLTGCIHKPQIMDGPGMMYDFASYELNGQWTEILTDTPWKLSFADDQMTCTEGKEMKLFRPISISWTVPPTAEHSRLKIQILSFRSFCIADRFTSTSRSDCFLKRKELP